MSKNKRKKSHNTPATREEAPLSSRVVAIPKTEEFENLPEPAHAPEPELELHAAPTRHKWSEQAPETEILSYQEPEPPPYVVIQEPEPPRREDPVVILQEPEPAHREEPVATRQEPKPEFESKRMPQDPKPAPKAEAKASKPKAKHDRIGDVLRAARLERGDDLYLIAEYLCIKPAFLIALESSRYEELPADAYVIGFLRTYANFLGVDGKDAVDRYRYEMAGRRKKPVLSMPTPVSEGRAPSGIIMVAATIALLLIYALWYGFSSSDRVDHTPPPLPTATQTAPTGVDPAVAAGLTAPVAPAAAVSPIPAPQPPTADPTAPPQIPVSPTVSAAPTPPVAPAATAPAAPAPQPVSSAPSAPTATPANTATASGALPPAGPGIVVTAEKSQAANTPPKEASLDAAANKEVDPKADKLGAPEKKSQFFGDQDKPSRVVIRATQNSWIMVVDQTGKTIFDRVLKPGDAYRVPNAPGLSLTTGNGNGIVLSLDGADLPKVASGAPHMVRNIPLDPARLESAPVLSDR